MKKLFLILTTALFAAGFASCTDDPEETVNPVVVSEILRALGGNVLVNVPEENFDVNIPADAASWVQINEAESSGKALVLSVDENETGTERSTVVNVTRSGKSTVLATVTIKQSDITLQAGEFVIEEWVELRGVGLKSKESQARRFPKRESLTGGWATSTSRSVTTPTKTSMPTA